MNHLSFSEKLFIDFKAQFNINFPLKINSTVLACVSGGVDSVVMFHLLKKYSLELGLNLFCITVNHNIREKKESSRDAEFVKTLSKKLDVPFFEKVYEENFISSIEKQRKNGIEEAARFCRYKAIEEYAEKIQADCICFAHNKNDQLETLLQQFFQGSILNCGIPISRNKIFRPLLNISRKEIEKYAKENDLCFCLDSTNLENVYYRNKVRNQLIPVLDSLIPGWEKGVLSNQKKVRDVNLFLSKELEKYSWSYVDNTVVFDLEKFTKLEKIIKINLLYEGINFLYKKKKEEKEALDFVRFPYDLLEMFSCNLNKIKSGNFEIYCENQQIKITLQKKEYENFKFYTIISDVGLWKLPFGDIEIVASENGYFCARNLASSHVSGDFHLPLVIRSREDTDEIEDKNKNKKSIAKIFSEWKVPENVKNQIPIFCDEQIRGIWGEPFGFNNFFVKCKDDFQK